jgi:PhoH-like ATPase
MRKHYILDTNILIENPKSIEILRNGLENFIYIPYAVINELDSLKTKKPYIIKEITKELLLHKDHIEIIYGDFDEEHDDLILAQICKFILEHSELSPIIFVTNEKLLSFKAQKANIQTEEFKQSLIIESLL